MDLFVDSHYVPFRSQGNVYLSTKLSKKDGTRKLLVATLSKQIYLIDYQLIHSKFEPVTKELHFSYLPVASEITSIDAFNRSESADDFVIALTMMKRPTSEHSIFGNSYLNLYSEYDTECHPKLNFENIGQSCESISLQYIPYGIRHARISPHQINGCYENAWLLPGGDGKIHTYRGFYTERCHGEVACETLFPELEKIEGIVLSLDIIYYNNYRNRISAFGFEGGHLSCFFVNSYKNIVLKQLVSETECPISNLTFFTLTIPTWSFDEFLKKYDEEVDLVEDDEINLLVTNTLYESDVYMNILQCDFKNRKCLPGSGQYDVCTCSVVADINFDGNKEIVIGTYGEILLVFRYADGKRWELANRVTVPNPVHKLFYEELNEDGVSELIVITMKGLHVYQHDPESIYEIVCSRTKELLSSEDDSKNDEKADTNNSAR